MDGYWFDSGDVEYPRPVEEVIDVTIVDACHCGEPVDYGFDGDPTHHRGMCAHCDAVRCDAYPGECRR